MRRTAATALTLAVLLSACSAAVTDTGDATAAVPAAPGGEGASSADDGAGTATGTAAQAADPAAEPAAAPAEPTGSDGSDGSGEEGEEQPAAAAAGTDEGEVPPTLWWSADRLDGGTFTAADVAGQKMVLWMWAPWCSVCNAEAPDVARVVADLPADVTLVGVAGRDDREPMAAFVAEHGLEGMVHVVDDTGEIWSSYGVSYQPAWVFIDEDGTASVAAGAIGYDGLFQALDVAFG